LLQHPLVDDCRKIVGGRPVLRGILDTKIDLIALEGLEGDGCVPKILIAKLVEIGATAIDRKIAAPEILYALQRNRPSGNELLDPVWAGPERHFQRGRRDVALAAVCVSAFPPMLGKDVQLTDDQRQLTVAGTVEGELDLAVIQLLGLHDMT